MMIMKEFFKHTLATVAGLIVFSIVAGIVGLGALAGMLVSDSSVRPVGEGSVMVLNLRGSIEERADGNIWGSLMGSADETTGLDQMLAAIAAASSNPDIEGIYIKAGLLTSIAPASAKAIRRELEQFQAGSGKWIVAYGDTYTQTAYYICSVADSLLLNPQGMIVWQGMASQPIFLKDLLARLGVRVQLVKVGKYKSAPEMLTADKMSPENKEQTRAYVDGIWAEIKKDVAKSRGISEQTLDSLADEQVTLAPPAWFVGYGMVDRLAYETDVKSAINLRMGRDEKEDVSFVSISDVVAAGEPQRGSDEVAVYYAYGDIVEQRVEGLGQGDHCIDATEMVADLEELADDDDIKAVVLRVNSPGGSAYASEQIWHAVSELRQKKPVVVSMGGYAASGGYYISCAANYIVSEPTTLTGSIGIFGMYPDASELLTKKLGIGFDVVKTNMMSDFGTPSRPFSREETALLEAYVDRGYELFRKRVADGRGLQVEEVEAIAQGRVWLGKDALDIHLVDALGSLDDAILKAAELAQLTEWHTGAYPEQKHWMEQLMDACAGAGDHYVDSRLRQALGDLYEPLRAATAMGQGSPLVARMPLLLLTK